MPANTVYPARVPMDCTARYIRDELFARVRCSSCGAIAPKIKDGNYEQWHKGLCDRCRLMSKEYRR